MIAGIADTVQQRGANLLALEVAVERLARLVDAAAPACAVTVSSDTLRELTARLRPVLMAARKHHLDNVRSELRKTACRDR